MAGNRDAYQKAMNQGHSAAWDQEWEKAAACYRAAMNEFPNDPRALTSLGLALFELQEFPVALETYQRAAGYAPEDPVPQEKIARIYERMGRLNDAITASLQAAELHLKTRSADKAIENWLRVLSITPENVQVRMRLAAVLEKLGRREEAVAEYISAASLMQRAGRQGNAVRAVEMALKVMPENQEVRLAMQMVRTGQPLPRPNRPRGGTGPVRMASVRELEGQQTASGASQPDPLTEARQKAMVQLAGLLFDQVDESSVPAGRSRGLSALTRGIADLTGDTGDHTRIMLHIGQAIDSLTQGNDNQAAVELEHAAGLGLKEPSANYLLGYITRTRFPEKALKYLQQSVKHPDYTLASNLLIGSIYEAAEKWNEAAPIYLLALALADAQTVREDQREELMGQYDALVDAQTSLQDSTALKAACSTIKIQLLRPDWRAYLQQTRRHMPEQAEGNPSPMAEVLLETRGSQVIEAMTRVRQLANQGHVRSALEEALYALQEAPAYLPLHVLVADLLLQDQHTTEAVQKYMVVSELYAVRGEVPRAARILRQVAQILPTDLPIRQRLIELLLAQDAIEEALEEYASLGELFYQLADLDKARQAYLDALQAAKRSKNTRSWGVRLLLKVADIDMQRLNLRQALRIYEQIRVVQPDDVDTRAQIITLNIRLAQETTALRELDEAIQYFEGKGRRAELTAMIKGLLEEHRDRVDLHKRLVDIYMRGRQVKEAVAHLDSAADALVGENHPKEAARLLEMIISLNPPNVNDYRAALQAVRGPV